MSNDFRDPYLRHCRFCGKKLTTVWSNQWYCSPDHARRGANKRSRDKRAKFRKNLVAAGRTVNPYHWLDKRKRVLVPGRVTDETGGAKRSMPAKRAFRPPIKRRRRTGSPSARLPDPWE